MSRMMLMIDVEECTGCRICELACSIKHDREFAPFNARIRILKDEDNGINVPVVCQHCTDAPCALVCPLNLYHTDEETGAVLCRDEACIGCKACLLACPYGANSMDYKKMVSIKCDFCSGKPLCVDFCPSKAIQYVRVDQADQYLKRKFSRKLSQSVKEARVAERSEAK